MFKPNLKTFYLKSINQRTDEAAIHICACTCAARTRVRSYRQMWRVRFSFWKKKHNCFEKRQSGRNTFPHWCEPQAHSQPLLTLSRSSSSACILMCSNDTLIAVNTRNRDKSACLSWSVILTNILKEDVCTKEGVHNVVLELKSYSSELIKNVRIMLSSVQDPEKPKNTAQLSTQRWQLQRQRVE